MLDSVQVFEHDADHSEEAPAHSLDDVLDVIQRNACTLGGTDVLESGVAEAAIADEGSGRGAGCAVAG